MPRRTVPFDRILAPHPPLVEAIAALRAEVPYRVAAEDAYDTTLTDRERDAVFEIAAMMAQASGPVTLDEAHALSDLVAHLEGRPASTAELSTVLRKAGARRGNATAEERVRQLAAAMRRRVAREVAYKAAYAIRVSDLAANDAEADFDELLVEVLDLGAAAGELASQVNEALMD